MRWITLALWLSISGLPDTGWAQTSKRVGIVFGAPTSAGVLWDVTRRVTIRSDVSISGSSSESTAGTVISVDRNGRETIATTVVNVESQSFSPSVSGLVTLARWDSVRAYAGARFGASRVSITSRYSTSIDPPPTPTTTVVFAVPEPEDREDTEWSYTGGGLFGTQYTPHERFGVFGEVGVSVTAADQSQSTSRERLFTRQRSWGTTGRIGVVLYIR